MFLWKITNTWVHCVWLKAVGSYVWKQFVAVFWCAFAMCILVGSSSNTILLSSRLGILYTKSIILLFCTIKTSPIMVSTFVCRSPLQVCFRGKVLLKLIFQGALQHFWTRAVWTVNRLPCSFRGRERKKTTTINVLFYYYICNISQSFLCKGKQKPDNIHRRMCRKPSAKAILFKVSEAVRIACCFSKLGFVLTV